MYTYSSPWPSLAVSNQFQNLPTVPLDKEPLSPILHETLGPMICLDALGKKNNTAYAKS
jgi:hypothetical protein